MAAEAWPEITPLTGDILTQGHRYSFVQVLRLMLAWLGPDALERSLIRIRPELSLAFPAADVARVEMSGDELLVTTTFGGVYGVDSPLATFLTEELLDEASNDRSVIRGFLDIIHQRLYCLYAQCWSKYRTLIRLVEEGDPAELQRAWCLPGMGEREIADLVPDSFPFLRYGSLFARLTRPVSALEAILKDTLGIDAIEIIQCVRRVVPIPEDQQMRLDEANCILDVDAVLGPDVEDWTGKLVVRAGPLTWEQYNSLLPGTPLYNLLNLLVHLYLPHPLVLELELVLAEGEARPFVLDDPGFRLDYNVFVFDSVMPETSVLFPLPMLSMATGLQDPEFDSSTEGESGLVEYFKRELARFRDLAARFGREHPELEPLVAGPMADAGVERLLEGSAFLCALLQLKLDDDLPEIIHEVMRNTRPQEISPVPATTVIAFIPRQNCTGTHIIPAGTEVASVPVEETSCRFTTVYPVELHPLTLIDSSYVRPPGKPAMIVLTMELNGMRLADWRPERVRIFLSGEFGKAADLSLFLTRYLRRIIIIPTEGDVPTVLEPASLKPVGFGDWERLFPSPTRGAVSLHCIREHSVLPEKFLFLDLTGWDNWRERREGKHFEVRFELERPPFPLEGVTKDDFTLFATPAVNVFPHRARPVILGEEDAEYSLVPEGSNPEHYEVYSIEKVTGITEGSVERVLLRSSGSIPDANPAYLEIRHESLLREGYETAISVKLPPKPDPRHIKSVSAELKCTNGTLPASLGIGDIREHAETSLSFATFTNCKPVTRPLFDTLGDNRLWRLFGMQFINLRLLTAGSLRSALRLLYVSDGQGHATAERNERRIEGIRDFRIKACDRLVRQVMKRGWDIRITLDSECYGSPGDMYLFGGVLDHFLRGFVSEAYFSRLVVKDVRGDAEYVWTAKMGRRPVV